MIDGQYQDEAGVETQRRFEPSAHRREHAAAPLPVLDEAHLEPGSAVAMRDLEIGVQHPPFDQS